MGFDEYHMHLRLAQFDFASLKDKADPPPSSLISFIPDDISADRYQHLYKVFIYLNLYLLNGSKY